MSDERLRAAERRWKETGAVDDEAAYLLERVRAGTLPVSVLRLAAGLQDEAARLALGSEAEGAFLPGWDDLDPRIAVEVAILAARTVLPEWQRVYGEDEEPAEALVVAVAALQCPCPRHEELVAIAAFAANATAGAPVRLGGQSTETPWCQAGRATGAAAESVRCLIDGAPELAREEARRALDHACSSMTPETVASALLARAWDQELT